MSGILTEAERKEFLAFFDQADTDGETTGLFVCLLAPRRNGMVREALLTTGELPVELAERIARASRAKLVQHNEGR